MDDSPHLSMTQPDRAPSIPVIEHVACDDATIRVTLVDGRSLALPLAASYRLSAATPAQRANYRVDPFDQGIHWPDLDEDIGLHSFLGLSEEAFYDLLGFAAPTDGTSTD